MIPCRRRHTHGLRLPLTFRALTAILIITAAAQTAAVSIQGTVLNASSGKPVAGSIVTAIRNGLPPLSQTAISTAAGAFQFSGLPAATYELCVQVPAGGYLNPCSWVPNPP